MQEYRFNDKEHIHEIFDCGVWKPLIGTSTMSSVLAKPLTWWASGLCAEVFGWMSKGNAEKGWTPKGARITVSKTKREQISLLNDEEYLTLLDDAYAAHSKKLTSSAKSGKDMHSMMEEYVKFCIENNEGKPLGKPKNGCDAKLGIFIDWSISNVKKFLWSEGHCYSRAMWLGGISDCGYEDNEGRIAILDFKSSKEVYLSQFWQCVGYAIQIEENGVFTPDGELIMKIDKPIDYVAVLPFGMENPEVKFNQDVKGGKDAVNAMLLLYKKLN